MRLEPCSPFGWDRQPVVLPSSQGCEGIVLVRYAVVGLWTVVSGMWRLGMLEKAGVVATSLASAFPRSLMTSWIPTVTVRCFVNLGYV